MAALETITFPFSACELQQQKNRKPTERSVTVFSTDVFRLVMPFLMILIANIYWVLNRFPVLGKEPY